jgi:1,4-dihydroxy-2-naphthoate octaprenyltransferase
MRHDSRSDKRRVIRRGVAGLRDWLKAARPLAQANIAVPLFFGQAVAYARHGAFSLRWLLFIAAWGVVDQLFIVFANDYADRHADGPVRTPFSGGSGVLVEGLIEPLVLLRAAIGMAILLVGLSVLGALASRPLLIVSAVAALFLLHAYSFGPLRLSYRGGGEVLQALGVGAVLPLTSYYAQSGRIDLPVWALAPSALAALAGNLLTSVPDVTSDTRAGKRTLAVRAGVGTVIGLSVALLFVSFMLAYRLGGPFRPPLALVVASALPLAVAVGAWLRVRPRSRGRLLFVLFAGAAQHGFLLAWCLSLARGA